MGVREEACGVVEQRAQELARLALVRGAVLRDRALVEELVEGAPVAAPRGGVSLDREFPCETRAVARSGQAAASVSTTVRCGADSSAITSRGRSDVCEERCSRSSIAAS